MKQALQRYKQYLFGAAMIKEGNFAVMGACAAAICTPPLGLALATL